MRYFHIRGVNSRKAAVITVSQQFDELAFWDDLKARRSDFSWNPPQTCAQQGELVDWAPSNLLPRLCSDKLRRVLDGFSDAVVWLPVNVETSHGQEPYFILHFNEYATVIDPEKSTFVGDRLFKPHLAANKVAGDAFLPLSHCRRQRS